MRKHRRQRDASVEAPGPHDFAVRKTVTRQLTASRPSHPALNVHDDREAPLLVEAGRVESVMLRLANREAKYFLRRGWTRSANHLEGQHGQEHLHLSRTRRGMK